MRRTVLVVASILFGLFGIGVLVDAMRPSGADTVVGAVVGFAGLAIGAVLLVLSRRR
jgi:hypothetical protein